MVQSRVSKAVPLMLALCSMALGQLNQNCTVSVLNRNVQVNRDGSWVLPNIPANVGQVKARATCVQNGVTTSGESTFFTVPANGAVNLPTITLGSSNPIPTALAITPISPTLTTIGQAVQLQVTGTYPNNSTADLTAGVSGTTYTISNSAIASISANGLATAVASGTVVIQASNDGASGIVTIHVMPGGASHGGIPDSWAIANGLDPNNPTMPLEDPDRDGLTNLQEFQLGTDPNNPDTDGDGLSDGDEVNKYHTSPLIADTDGDGIPDGIEVHTGSDPLDRNSYDLSKAVSQFSVSPASFLLTVNAVAQNAFQQLAVTGKLIDGKTTIDLTSTTRRTNYSSSNLSVCTFGSPDGRVFAGSDGTCTITITNSGFTATATATVSTFNPIEISTLGIAGAVAVDVAGNHAYVAAGPNGLVIVDVTDRTHPVARATLAGIGDAEAIRVAGSYVFIADAGGFLRVVRILNPAAPALVTSLPIPGAPNALAVHANLAAVAAQAGGVSLVNIADPTGPSLIATFTTPVSALGVDFDPQRGLAAVAMGTGGVQIADISTPGTPRLHGRLPGGDVRRVLLRFPAVLLADVQRSVTAVDITNLDAPVLSSSIAPNLGGAPVDIAAYNDIGMTADVSFGRAVPILNVSNPLQPNTLVFLTLPSPGFSSSVAMDISFGYLITPDTLRISQYQKITDPFGIPPTIQITSPTIGPLIQGATVTLTANAVDDVSVASVTLLANGQAVYTAQNPPYQTSYTVPTAATTITFGAIAVDYGNNLGTAVNVMLPVIPDPLTSARGRVLDSVNLPVAGATVSALGKSATTAADGTFTIAGLPTIQGSIVVLATALVNGVTLGGLSTPTPPVPGGATNVGDIGILPRPVISGLKQKGALAGSVVTSFTVRGANLATATFSLLPATNPPPITITIVSASPSGDSANLTLNVAANASGQVAFLATNNFGTSDPNPSFQNTITILSDPDADSDLDGLSNAQEAQLGTDPLNSDTDGDGFSDGVEIASGSNPLDPNCTPLNCRISADVTSLTFSVLNTGPAGASQGESDSFPFSVLMVGATTLAPLESDSVPFSVLNALSATSLLSEADSIPFSVCNAAGPCTGYSPLSVRSKSQGIGRSSMVGGQGLGTGGATTPVGGRPFAVLSVAPGNGAVNIGLRSTVALAFSAPIDPASINPQNFSLVAGDQPLEAELRYSTDFRTVMLRAPLPPDSSIRVSALGQVRDLWGRQLPAFESEFHTAGVSLDVSLDTASPVVAQRPPLGATGVNPDLSPIRLYMTRAIDARLAGNALRITQDGDPLDGAVRVTEGGGVVEFIPYTSLRAGAVVQIAWSGIAYAHGRRTAGYQGLFTAAPAAGEVAEALTAVPGRTARTALNPVIEIEYSRPLDAATVAEGSVMLSESSTSQPLSASIVLRGDRIIRILPAEPLRPESTYTYAVSGNVLDLTGQPATPVQQNLTTGTEGAFGLPRLLSASPAEGATDVDATAEIRLLFDRAVNPLTLGSETVWIIQDGVREAVSISLATEGREVVLTPDVPFRASSRVQVTATGIEDLSGNAAPLSTIRFQVRTASKLLAARVRGKTGTLRAGGLVPAKRRVVRFLIGRR